MRPADPVPRASNPGRPLADGVRSEMEAAFGRGLGHVRVHDGPAADSAARGLHARAFTHGAALTFAEGHYRPHTPEGRGLLAHELAHVLQGGAADDARAEAEADAAAGTIAAGGRPGVTDRPGPPRVHRAPATKAPPPSIPATPAAAAAGTGTAPSQAPAQTTTAGTAPHRLPDGLDVIKDEPNGLGTEELVVRVRSFALPVEKGAGPWVNAAHQEALAGGRLVFSPVINGEDVAAFKEGREDYKSVWLGRFGFTTTAEVAKAFTSSTKVTVKASLADPAVKKFVGDLGKGLRDARADVDHIVEKQLGGTSIPSNLQLLVSSKNQESGRETYQALAGIVRQIRSPAYRDKTVRRLQLRIGAITVPAGTADPSGIVEGHLRAGDVTGSDVVTAAAAGKAVSLQAGGIGETVMLRDTGSTPLDSMSRRIVPGMRLARYVRGKGGASSPKDTVVGVLDSRVVSQTKADAGVELTAELPSSAPAAGQPAAAGAPGPAAAPAGEVRVLRLNRKDFSAIEFYYPYLSPGRLTSMALDEQGRLTAEGVIARPSVPFLGPLSVALAGEELRLVAPIPAATMRSPLPSAFRFTGGEVALQLSPALVPSGSLQFSVGPAAAPVALGDLTLTLAQGVPVARGTLTPGRAIPGVAAVAGVVEWNAETGWAGRITASSTSLPRSTADVEIGFRTSEGRFDPYATGGIHTTIGDAALDLGARWGGGHIDYHGSVVVAKPLPFVDRVRLGGRFAERGLWLEGDAAIAVHGFTGTMHVVYSRKEQEEQGRFSGSATIVVRTAKADGSILLTADDGGYRGKGSIGYQVTKDIRPVLGVELTKDHRLRLSGEVAIGDIPLGGRWPSAAGGRISVIKGLGVKFGIPTPVPAVTAFGEIRGSLGLGYGVGPVTLTGVAFAGELYPLEDDPKIRATLRGALVVPAHAELNGRFGAYIGLEVALGAVGAKGGIEISPSLRLAGVARLDVDAAYGADGFAFSAEASAGGQLTASADVDLVAELSAVYGLVSHTWTYKAASVSAPLGPALRLKLGKVGYSKGQITWPSLSDISVEPESIDPLAVVKDMLTRGQAKEK